MKTLNHLKAGEKGNVLSLAGIGSIKRRLMDMGIVQGTEIEIVKVAPLGDPLEVRLRGYNLSLRKAEAKLVIIAK